MDNTKLTELNLTGKEQLTTEESIEHCEELWKRTPHSFNWSSDEKIKGL